MLFGCAMGICYERFDCNTYQLGPYCQTIDRGLERHWMTRVNKTQFMNIRSGRKCKPFLANETQFVNTICGHK